MSRHRLVFVRALVGYAKSADGNVAKKKELADTRAEKLVVGEVGTRKSVVRSAKSKNLLAPGIY